MKTKLQKGLFVYIILMIVILIFTIIDHFMHGLSDKWSVPDFYFKDKIPFGFLWGVVGLWFAQKSKKVWLKSLIFSGIIAVTLQTRYFIEGYSISFVLLFLLFHFIILYLLSIGMFMVLNKNYQFNNKNMKKIIITIVVLLVVGIATYYIVFNNNSNKIQAPSNQNTYVQSDTQIQDQTQTSVISIKNFAFNPKIVSIKAGQKITWTNNDSAPHTITSDSGTTLNSSTLEPGQSFSFTFTDTGTFNYHCTFHPMMKGTVVVSK